MKISFIVTCEGKSATVIADTLTDVAHYITAGNNAETKKLATILERTPFAAQEFPHGSDVWRVTPYRHYTAE